MAIKCKVGESLVTENGKTFRGHHSHKSSVEARDCAKKGGVISSEGSMERMVRWALNERVKTGASAEEAVAEVILAICNIAEDHFLGEQEQAA